MIKLNLLLEYIKAYQIAGLILLRYQFLNLFWGNLKFEYFYTPGTIILTDGRSANAKFLKDNFQRNWKYIHNKKNDQHIFYLDDPVLGKYNKLQLDFYRS